MKSLLHTIAQDVKSDRSLNAEVKERVLYILRYAAESEKKMIMTAHVAGQEFQGGLSVNKEALAYYNNLPNELRVLETTQIDSDAHPIFFDAIIEGKKVRLMIGDNSRNFYEKLLSLPAETRIMLMKLSADDMLSHANNRIKELRKQVKELLKRTWYYVEDDYYAVDFKVEDVCQDLFGVTSDKLFGKLSEEEAIRIIDVFINDFPRLKDHQTQIGDQKD